MAKAVDKSKTKRTNRLGRGLSSLMARPVTITPPSIEESIEQDSRADETPTAIATAEPVSTANATATPELSTATTSPDNRASNAGLVYLSVHVIQPNRHQPRQHFDQTALQQLADSIRAEGLIQPIVVRPLSQPDVQATHELVAGERRWRAAQLAGLEVLPAIVRELDDQQMAEWALIENLQREDLNPIERAEAFQHLIDRFGFSHEQVASRVGVDRSTVSNLLRLLMLSEPVRQLVQAGRLSMGQARALAAVSDKQLQLTLANQAIRQEWSVRKIEQAVRAAIEGQPDTGPIAPAKARTGHLRDLEEQIGQQLNTRVRIRPGRKKGSGTLSIEFYSLDQFDAMLAALGVQTES